MSDFCRQLSLVLPCLLLVAPAPATAQIPIALLHSLADASNPNRGARLGYKTAVDGNTVVVAAPYDGTSATDYGVVKAFDLNTGTLILTLTNPSPAAADFFGLSVGISGSRVVVGAPNNDTGAEDAGSVYVYDLTNSTPTVPVFVITNPSPARSDLFGSAVAISAKTLVIGARHDDSGSVPAGSAYVYDLGGAAPTVPLVTLPKPDPAPDDAFGWALGISGTKVVIGARWDDTGAPDAGTVYVFDLTSASLPTPITTLTNPAPASGDSFGNTVAISGTRVVVGAYADNPGRSGSAFVYDLASATPASPAIYLYFPNPAQADLFGSSVAIDGSRVVVGALHDSNGLIFNAGSAFVYDLSNASPHIPVAMLQNPDRAVSDWFGVSVAVSGSRVVVGSPGGGATDAGIAYIFGPTPALNIAPTPPGFATLSWAPLTSSGFVLQYTDSLTPTNWINAPSGATNPVVLPATNVSRFHRLIQQ